MTGSGESNDNALLGALKHPVRRRILRAMEDEEPRTESELAKELEQSLISLRFHLRVLTGNGALEPAGTRKVDGVAQPLYRWSLRDEWARAMLRETDG